MSFDLYYNEFSIPSRAVLLTARALGVNYNKKYINLMKGEQMQPSFLALNPQHCVPTLVEGDFVLWESRAIQAYLVDKYGKNDALYPKDLKKRAIVDKILYFDLGTLFKRFIDYFGPVLMRDQKPDPEKKQKFIDSFVFLDKFLEGQNWVAGNHITIADHGLIAVISLAIEIGVDTSQHPNVHAWVERCAKEMPGYDEENLEGAKKFGEKFVGKFK